MFRDTTVYALLELHNAQTSARRHVKPNQQALIADFVLRCCGSVQRNRCKPFSVAILGGGKTLSCAQPKPLEKIIWKLAGL